MNKGLEVIEAYHLFALRPDEIDVLVHPQSVVHGLVEFRDGSLIAQLGSPDMRIPIAHCLAWPQRIDGPAARLDLAQLSTLTFENPDLARFPALGLARQALESGAGAPTVLNAANEVAVADFLSQKLKFTGIVALVAATLEAAVRRGLTREPASIEDALSIDHDSRLLAAELLPEIAAKAF
jgi:1-deoxy-D-xylulose-5-phosphate reductoisomerase